MKIAGLISEYITPLIDSMIERSRRDENISDEEFDKLMEEAGEEVFDILEEKCADFFVKKYIVEEFRKQYAITQRNSNKLVEHHEEFFHYFTAYIHTAHIVYSNFIGWLKQSNIEASELELKDTIHLTMYGNLCRMADQIAIQLMHGYPDAALRLWRSFHEHAVIAIFLMKHDSNELAERFRDATSKENKKSVESYTKRHRDLKFPSLDEELINRVQKKFEEMKTTYTRDFFESDYSWASPFLDVKASFIALEEATDLSRFRPFYIWSSSKVHPTYKGIMDFRDSTNSTVLEYITLQEGDRRSMVDPAQLTLGVFHDVNNHFLHLYSGHEYTINQLLFRKIYDRFGETITKEKVDGLS